MRENLLITRHICLFIAYNMCKLQQNSKFLNNFEKSLEKSFIIYYNKGEFYLKTSDFEFQYFKTCKKECKNELL